MKSVIFEPERAARVGEPIGVEEQGVAGGKFDRRVDGPNIGQNAEKLTFLSDRVAGVTKGSIPRWNRLGLQYAPAQITAFAAANGITRTMGRTGVCWDNAAPL